MKVCVSSRSREPPDPHGGDIATEKLELIKSTWCFDSFPESRLLGLGASARILVTASLLGLEDLKQFVRTALG